MNDKNGDLLKGLFIGGLIGLALGILFAPKSGKESRDDFARKANDLLAKVKDEYEKVMARNKPVREDSLGDMNGLNLTAKEGADDIENQDDRLVQHGAEPIKGHKNRFKKAIDAGLKAYKEESNKEKI